jgi:hypothetical protein
VKLTYLETAIDYEDEKTKLTTSLSLKKLMVKFDKTDIYNRFILIDNIALSNGTGKLLGK